MYAVGQWWLLARIFCEASLPSLLVSSLTPASAMPFPVDQGHFDVIKNWPHHRLL